MSGAETVDPEQLRHLAEQLHSQLQPLLEQTMQKLEATEIAGPAFSLDGPELWVTYPGLRHFAMRDLESKAQAIKSIIDRLKSTATLWETTEHHSTVKAH